MARVTDQNCLNAREWVQIPADSYQWVIHEFMHDIHYLHHLLCGEGKQREETSTHKKILQLAWPLPDRHSYESRLVPYDVIIVIIIITSSQLAIAQAFFCLRYLSLYLAIAIQFYRMIAHISSTRLAVGGQTLSFPISGIFIYVEDLRF